MEQERAKRSDLSFNRLLLSGVVLIMVVLGGMAALFFVFPSTTLEIPELQPVIRITREADFPVGGSRIRVWGDRTILVVRPDEGRYFALQGTSPADGCVLRWELTSLSIYSPCRHVVYNLRGDVIAGMSTQPLRRYPVSVRDGVVYVSEPER